MVEYTNEKFEEMRNDMIQHFKEMSHNEYLFLVDFDKEELYNLYLDSFPEEIKGVYREKAWHDCTVCRRFLQQYGGIVTINEEYEPVTLFGFETLPEYQMVMDKLDEYIKGCKIKSTFYSSREELGVLENFEQLDDGTVSKHSHFYLEIPNFYIRDGKKIDKFKSDDEASKDVFKGSLERISLDSVDTVLELIDGNQLYRGAEWKNILSSFRKLLKEYQTLDGDDLDNFLWYHTVNTSRGLSRIKNHSIGVLLKDLTKGKDLEYAVKKYEEIVAPHNYKRPKPLFTQKMLDDAEEKITELGYLESLPRRFAKLSDISVNDILYVNRSVKDELKDSLFKELSKDALVQPKDFNNVDEISLEDFTSKVLPGATNVELYFANNLISNLVSLIAPVNEDSPSMFKWDNNYCWAYKDNVADSMKQRVKEMGGDVDVDLRFSIQWNDTGEWDQNDLDAHCTTPSGEEIYYSHKRSQRTGGWLDVDIIHPEQREVAVENIRFKDRFKMIPGAYLFRVHQFSYRGGDYGFKAEIEFDGEIYSFDYPHKLQQGEYVDVAKVTLNKGKFDIERLLSAKLSNRKEWGITTNHFIPVNLVCYSPNYWDESKGTGNKHVFFMLKECVNDTRPNAWYNEYLNNELNEHRKVMEALGSKARVEESDEQLSGVGFSTTKHDSFVVKVDDNIYKVVI